MLKIRATSGGECANGLFDGTKSPKIAVRGALQLRGTGVVARGKHLFTPPKKSGASFEFNSTYSRLRAGY